MAGDKSLEEQVKILQKQFGEVVKLFNAFYTIEKTLFDC